MTGMSRRARIVWILFFTHLAALIFGVAGILIALPNPHLWADSRFGADAFSFGMQYGGSLHIILGAAAMLAFGGFYIGWRKTLIFFTVTVVLSLSSELIGTGTGWPFGNYEYTGGLGYKVLGRVPFTIPLSWFYVGFACYLLANIVAARYSGWKHALVAVGGGAYLMTVWDLVLDPAMAHEALAIQFWVWFETGPYFGMPLKNFVGWTVTALLFMGVSRFLWRNDIDPRRVPANLPFAVFLVNMFFAMALSLGVGLWEPVIIAAVLGLVPAVYAWRYQPPERESTRARTTQPVQPSTAEIVGGRMMRMAAKGAVSRKIDLEVEGAQHLPEHGPVLIASRHYHHLYDGCALVATSPRPLHILVGLDWVKGKQGRRMMEAACGMVRWPIVLRDDGLTAQSGDSAFDPAESRRYMRNAVRESVDLLRSGAALVVFPEAFPNIDPTYTPKSEKDGFLAFRQGFVRLAELAQRDGATRVPIVPAGFAYEQLENDRWRVTLRFGAPLTLNSSAERERVGRMVEDQVRILSIPGEPAGAVMPEALTS